MSTASEQEWKLFDEELFATEKNEWQSFQDQMEQIRKRNLKRLYELDAAIDGAIACLNRSAGPGGGGGGAGPTSLINTRGSLERLRKGARALFPVRPIRRTEWQEKKPLTRGQGGGGGHSGPEEFVPYDLEFESKWVQTFADELRNLMASQSDHIRGRFVSLFEAPLQAFLCIDDAIETNPADAIKHDIFCMLDHHLGGQEMYVLGGRDYLEEKWNESDQLAEVVSLISRIVNDQGLREHLIRSAGTILQPTRI